MTISHTIPTTPCPNYGAGHFKSEAIILIQGSSGAGGPGGWFVGGWDNSGEGRTEFQGELVKGPHAYIGGRASVLDNHGGTGAVWKRAEAEGLLFRLKAGEPVAIHGTVYRLSLCKRGYPSLTAV